MQGNIFLLEYHMDYRSKKEVYEKIIINRRILFFYIYIFKYMKLFDKNKAFNKIILKNFNVNDNLYFYNKNFYKYIYLLLNYKKYNYNKKINNFIILEMLYKNLLNNNKYNFSYNTFFNYWYSIYPITKFHMRIDQLFFIYFKEYTYYFKLYKYNEYIFNHKLLYKYPFLKKFLRILWRGPIFKQNINLITEGGIVNHIRLYITEIEDNVVYNKLYINNKNVNTYLNIKNTYLLKNIININFFKLIEEYMLNIFLLLIYKISITYYEEFDWIEIQSFIFQTLEGFYYQLPFHKFNIKKWLYIYIYIYLYKTYFNINIKLSHVNYLYENFIEEDLYNIYLNVFWYNFIYLTIIDSINPYFFLYITELRNHDKKYLFSNKKGYKFLTYNIDIFERFVILWKILVQSCIYDFVLIDMLKFSGWLFRNNFSYISWNIFYIGNNNINLYYNFNEIVIFDQIDLDNSINPKNYLNTNIFFYLIKNNNNVYLINFFFLFLQVRDFFIKLFLKLNIIKYIYNINIFVNYNKLYEKKILLYNIKKKNYFLCYNNYSLLNKNLYIYYYDKHLILQCFIYLIKKYNLLFCVFLILIRK